MRHNTASQPKSLLVLKSDLNMLYKIMTQSISLTNMFTCECHTWNYKFGATIAIVTSSLIPVRTERQHLPPKHFTCQTSLINHGSLSHRAQMQCQNSSMQDSKTPLVIKWSSHARWNLSAILVLWYKHTEHSKDTKSIQSWLWSQCSKIKEIQQLLRENNS